MSPPIEGVSDIRRLPRLGKVRLGIKKEGQKGAYPQAVDYFVCPEEVKSIYGEQPRELPILFPSDDLGLVAPQWMKCYSYSQGLICKGDGRHCHRKVDIDTGDFAGRDTKKWDWVDALCGPDHCPKIGDKQCRRIMSLLFILPEVPGLGTYQLDTSSFFSIVNLNSQLAPGGFLRHFTGGRIAFIPLVLSVVPQEVNPPGQGRKTIHILSVRSDVKLADIIRISRQRPSQVLLPTLAEDEPPEDLFPEEVLKEEAAPPVEDPPPSAHVVGPGAASVSEVTGQPHGAPAPSQSKPEPTFDERFGPDPPPRVSMEAIDRIWLKETLAALKWSDTTALSYLSSRFNASGRTLEEALPKLSHKEAEEFTRHLNARLEKQPRF